MTLVRFNQFWYNLPLTFELTFELPYGLTFFLQLGIVLIKSIKIWR